MKLLIVLAVALIGVCRADYSEYQLRVTMDAARACYQELEIPTDSDMIQRIIYNKDGIYGELEMKLLTCTFRGVDWIDSEGDFKRQSMVDLLSDKYDRELVTELIDLCIQYDEGDSLISRVEKFHRCYFANKRYEV